MLNILQIGSWSVIPMAGNGTTQKSISFRFMWIRNLKVIKAKTELANLDSRFIRQLLKLCVVVGIN